MIEAKNLIKDYGIHRAVDDVSFNVKKGDILGFLGPNGAGKSTSMKMITGFLPPTGGTAVIGGHDILKDPVKAKKLIGYLPESGPLYPEMTVTEFLSFISELREINPQSAIDKVTDICRLEEVKYQTIDTLSKGYRQRVGMAQAILHDPSFLIMDEPTDGLDPNQKQEVRKLIARMAEDKAIVLSTHILEEVEAMCNRVIIIAKGKILVDETPEKLLKRHKSYNSINLALSGTEEENAKEIIEGIDGVTKITDSDKGYLIHGEDRIKLKENLWGLVHEKKWKVSHMENADTNLEDVFSELTLNDKKS